VSVYICIFTSTKVSSDTKMYLSVKKIIRMILHAERRAHCIFTQFNIFPPAAKYFCQCYNFLYINWKHIEPNVNLSKHQTGVCYPGITHKLFSNLQPTIKNLNDIKCIEATTERVSVISLILLCIRVMHKFPVIVKICGLMM